MTYWITLEKPIKYRGAMRQGFSVDGDNESQAIDNANRIFAMAGFKINDANVVDAKPLPYPGEPRLDYKSGDCPSFCMHPDRCAGRTSCPRSIACCE